MSDREPETSASEQGDVEEEQEVDCRQMKKGFAKRAKQEDIRLALRAACSVFVKDNNPIYERMSAEATDDYCHYASLFIGKIWVDSVQKIIDGEAGSMVFGCTRIASAIT